MVLDRYRAGATPFFEPYARAMGRIGFTPNVMTGVSLVFAFAAGVAFTLASTTLPLALFLAAAFTLIASLLDLLDGLLARLQGTASRLGDYLDHVVDRYSDLAILVGVSLSSLADVRLGLLAIAGTFLTSYMGTQAQALGLGRNYGGLLGRADRLVLLMSAPMIELGLLLLDVPVPALAGIRLGALNAMLLWFGVAGNITALQRFAVAYRELKDAPP